MADTAWTYADPTDRWPRRTLIRAIEAMTGQPQVRRLYEKHRHHRLPGESFWAACFRVMNIRLEVRGDDHLTWPRSGPLVVIANHPFGVLDGLALAELVGSVRPDYRVLTNAVLTRAPETQPYLLPIDFSDSPHARRTTLASRAAARAWLKDGGCLVLFPAGAVATSEKPFARQAVDLPWKPFLGGLVRGARADVAPVWFDGQNSRLFQIASHVSETLRLSLLFKEARARFDGSLSLTPGAAIPFEALAHYQSRQALTDDLRGRLDALGTRVG